MLGNTIEKVIYTIKSILDNLIFKRLLKKVGCLKPAIVEGTF